MKKRRILSAVDAPRTRKQALSHPNARHYAKARNEELDSLENTGTIVYVPCSEDPLGTKLQHFSYDIRTKTDSNNSITRYWVHCALRGDEQESYLQFDPHTLSSPVADRAAMRISLVEAFANNCIAEHFDIQAAFLHERLDPSEYIYAVQPTRFNGSYKYPDCVVRIEGNM